MKRDMSDQTYTRAQEGAFRAEHIFAYFCAAAAAVLAALGLLEGVGAVDLVSAGDVSSVTSDGQVAGEASFFDGLLFLIPAATLAFLSLYFHTSDHHRMRDVRSLDDEDAAMWGVEHLGAIVAAVISLGLMFIGLLVGFGAFDTANDAEDGLIWQIAGLVPAVLSCTLHQVRHHQITSEHDHIVAIVEQRVSRGSREPTRTAEPSLRRN